MDFYFNKYIPQVSSKQRYVKRESLAEEEAKVENEHFSAAAQTRIGLLRDEVRNLQEQLHAAKRDVASEHERVRMAMALFDSTVETMAPTVKIDDNRSILRQNPQIELLNHSTQSIEFLISNDGTNLTTVAQEFKAALKLKLEYFTVKGEVKREQKLLNYPDALTRGTIHGKQTTTINLPNKSNLILFYSHKWIQADSYTVHRGDVIHLLPPRMVPIAEFPDVEDYSRRDLLERSIEDVRSYYEMQEGKTSEVEDKDFSKVFHMPLNFWESDKIYASADVLITHSFERKMITKDEAEKLQLLVNRREKVIADLIMSVRIEQECGRSMLSHFSSTGKRLVKCFTSKDESTKSGFFDVDLHDVINKRDFTTVFLDIPGVVVKDLRVDFKRSTNQIIVEGSREKTGPGKRHHGKIETIISLPKDTKYGQSEPIATMMRGVMEIRVPKDVEDLESIPVTDMQDK